MREATPTLANETILSSEPRPGEATAASLDPAALGTTLPLSDEALVVAAVLGSEDAFAELSARYRPALARTATALLAARGLSIGAAADQADDVAQDALAIAWRCLPGLHSPDRFGAWLNAITRNAARRAARQRLREPAAGEQPAGSERDNPSPAPDPLQAMLRDESQRRLYQRLAALPETYRLPLLLHYWDDVPVARIASYLGSTVATVKWRMYQARKALRAGLSTLDESQAPAERETPEDTVHDGRANT